MYADVVVLTYQSPEIDSYTYLIPKELEKEIKIGQLVEVPFGKRNPLGIVVNTSREIRNSKFEIRNLKEINSIKLDKPILLPYQITLLKWMSAYYLAPMVNCLNTILPELPRKLLMVNGSWKKENITTNYELSTMNQHLILIPSINRIPETLAKFPKAKNYVVYHNELKPAEKFEAWLKILSGQIDYIFGSRSAIFTPCPSLKEIVIYNEHDGAFKDERSPYFDTLTVAQKISNLTGAQLKIVDPAPKIATYFQLKNHIKIQNFAQKTTIVNMQNERQSARYSPVSFDLEEEIEDTLDEKGSIFLFLNKKKESGHLFCKSCKTAEFLQNHPNLCPNCSSPDIFWNVLNIESLALEVKKLFPKTKVNIISSISPLSQSIRRQIDIGTAYSLYAPLLKRYDLVAHIQTDSLANITDFNSQEKLYQQIISLKKLLATGGKLFLQTYNVDSNVANFAAAGNYQSFFDSELSQRKLLFYPPYGVLCKLTLKGKDKDKTFKDAERLAANLRSKAKDPQLEILGAYQLLFWQKNPTYNIILKYKLKSFDLAQRDTAIAKIKNLIGPLPKGWQKIVDPSSIN
ncbi:MAG: Primosomal protein N [Candidatus Curtissbacteria bacterium GW2011_GWA1_40_16]|uniref:Primosomal protein N n=1 Tax=Candidatus Curtissbacteria bacterium GW2011_GWA1_40_16 TaxID=1618405 RepID=A0A0G0RFL1_9BACT|nr:MAG: Primosomal protein N [Candidatus Curtissbacteria bacterium GW2011_GWA1_40_16]